MLPRCQNIGVRISQRIRCTLAHFLRRVRADTWRNTGQKISNCTRVGLGADTMQQDKRSITSTIIHELAPL